MMPATSSEAIFGADPRTSAIQVSTRGQPASRDIQKARVHAGPIMARAAGLAIGVALLAQTERRPPRGRDRSAWFELSVLATDHAAQARARCGEVILGLGSTPAEALVVGAKP